jgi:hypothetical protein
LKTLNNKAMKTPIEKTFYIYYKTIENYTNNFVYAIRKCKYPERTKEYKRLQGLLTIGTIEACGWCDNDYFEDYKTNFIF